MVMLVMRSRRPRRWVGVALLAGLLGLLWWAEPPPAVMTQQQPASAEESDFWDSGVLLLERASAEDAESSFLARAQSAPLTLVAPSVSSSTWGAMPTR